MSLSEDSEPKRPKAPKPVTFQLAHLQAGRKTWHDGASGGAVTFPSCFGGAAKPVPKKEVLLLGKVLFGRQRFAFELQEVNHSPAAVRKILDKAKEMQNARFGCWSDDEGSQAKELSIFDVVRADELTAKHSIQVKFQDIERIDVAGSAVTLSLSKAPQCYVKPEGEMSIVQMEVAKDITGGARSITFTAGPGEQGERLLRQKSDTASFSEVQRLISAFSPRMDALFRGVAPRPVATPARKRKNSEPAGAEKKPRADLTVLLKDIAAPKGSWLRQAVERFQLKGMVGSVLESQWKEYFRERVVLEMDRQTSLTSEDSEEEEEEEVVWPDCLGERPEFDGLCYESYREKEEEREFASEVLEGIRTSVEATIKSSALKLDPEAFAQGVFLLSYDINSEDVDTPRTVEATARIYAPNATGNYLDLSYTNHHRVRMSFTERFSHLYVTRSGPNIEPTAPRLNGKQGEKIFDLDYNEHRRKNPVKRSLASNATLASLGCHLFGEMGAMSNRKIFGLLVRAVGLGKFGEVNGWPIAMGVGYLKHPDAAYTFAFSCSARHDQHNPKLKKRMGLKDRAVAFVYVPLVAMSWHGMLYLRRVRGMVPGAHNYCHPWRVKCSGSRQALELLALAERRYGVHAHHTTGALSALHRAHRWQRAAHLLWRGVSLRLQLEWTKDVVSLSCLASAYERGSAWQGALALVFQEMACAQLRPNAVALTAALRACGRTNKVGKLQMRSWELDSVALSSLAAAYEKASQWEHALEFAKIGIDAKLPLYGVVAGACEKASLWREALALLPQMATRLLQPNELVVNSLLSNLQQSAQWQRALALFKDLPGVDSVGLHAIFNACEEGGVRVLPEELFISPLPSRQPRARERLQGERVLRVQELQNRGLLPALARFAFRRQVLNGLQDWLRSRPDQSDAPVDVLDVGMGFTREVLISFHAANEGERCVPSPAALVTASLGLFPRRPLLWALGLQADALLYREGVLLLQERIQLPSVQRPGMPCKALQNDFIRNNRGINEGEDIPQVQKQVFESIRQDEIKTPSSLGEVPGFGLDSLHAGVVAFLRCASLSGQAGGFLRRLGLSFRNALARAPG
ncbi:unnamed protein product [Effrenium voratum]|uniref:Pentatricopeptide repeat-containing protein, chloroplastic n=1 Tax=Effrenium voratum TaxID=2562239 RepID=A0AA36JCM3_9DINO|nr:unnamed protein product [Effrenium voratum]